MVSPNLCKGVQSISEVGLPIGQILLSMMMKMIAGRRDIYHNADFKPEGGMGWHGMAFFTSPKFCAW
jgi:hypothetical protein